MVKIKGLKGKKAVNRPKPKGALSKPPRLKAAVDGASALAGSVEDAFQMDTLGEAMPTERTKQKSRTKHSKVTCLYGEGVHRERLQREDASFSPGDGDSPERADSD